MRLRSTTTSSSQRRSLREGSASWRRRAPVRPETREPGSSRSPAGVVLGNRPLAGARWRDRRSAPQRGFVRESVRTCVAAGVLGFSPERLYPFSPLPLPSPWSVLFPAPIPGGAVGPKAEGGVLLCRPARRRAAAPGPAPPGSLQRRRPRRTEAIQPPPPHRRKVSHGSVQDARYPGTWTVVVPEPARGRPALPDRRPWRRSGDSRRESVRTWRRWRCVCLLPRSTLDPAERHTSLRRTLRGTGAPPRSAPSTRLATLSPGTRCRGRSFAALGAGRQDGVALVGQQPPGELAARRAGGGPAASLRVGAGDRSRAGKRGGRPVARRAEENGAMTPRIGTGRS